MNKFSTGVLLIVLGFVVAIPLDVVGISAFVWFPLFLLLFSIGFALLASGVISDD